MNGRRVYAAPTRPTERAIDVSERRAGETRRRGLPLIHAASMGVALVFAHGAIALAQGLSQSPDPIVSRINAEFVKVLKQPDIVAKLNDQGYETVASTPEWFAQYVRSEVVKWTKVIKTAGIKGDP